MMLSAGEFSLPATRIVLITQAHSLKVVCITIHVNECAKPHRDLIGHIHIRDICTMQVHVYRMPYRSLPLHGRE